MYSTMGSLLKNIFIIGGLIAIAVGGYYLVVIERSSTVSTENVFTEDQTEQETQAFLRRLEDLESIELSTSLFADPRFNSFVDFTNEVLPLPYGRGNPFAR